MLLATRVLPLVVWGLAISPLGVNAADPATLFDSGASVVAEAIFGDGSHWLTPERAFRSTAPEPAVAPSSFPLLSVSPETGTAFFREGEAPAKPRRDDSDTTVTTRSPAGANPREPVEQTGPVRSARGSAGASPSHRVPESTASGGWGRPKGAPRRVVSGGSESLDPSHPQRKQALELLRGTTDRSVASDSVAERSVAERSVATPRTTKPQTAKQHVAEESVTEPDVTNRRIAEHGEPVTGDRTDAGDQSDAGGLRPQGTKVDISTAEEDVSLPVDQATQEIDADGTVNPFAGLEKLGESPPLAIENLPRLMLMTLLVLGTCLGTLLLGRRWLMRSGLAGESKRHARLQIVASLSVAPRSYLHVVRLDDREILVGVDARGLQQMQLVPPSFDAVLQSSSPPETRATKQDDAADATASQAVRRLFTAA